MKLTSLAQLIAPSLVAFSSLVLAEDSAPTNKPYDLSGTSSIKTSLSFLQIDSEVANREYIDTQAWLITLGWQHIFKQHYSAEVGFGFIGYDDNAGFSQRTRDQYGNIETSKSDAGAMPVYGEIGYHRYFENEQRTYILTRLGYTKLFGSERSIPSCSNCSSEPIDVAGGAYLNFGVGVQPDERFSLGLHYKMFVTGDLSSSFGLDLNFGF